MVVLIVPQVMGIQSTTLQNIKLHMQLTRRPKCPQKNPANPPRGLPKRLPPRETLNLLISQLHHPHFSPHPIYISPSHLQYSCHWKSLYHHHHNFHQIRIHPPSLSNNCSVVCIKCSNNNRRGACTLGCPDISSLGFVFSCYTYLFS